MSWWKKVLRRWKLVAAVLLPALILWGWLAIPWELARFYSAKEWEQIGQLGDAFGFFDRLLEFPGALGLRYVELPVPDRTVRRSLLGRVATGRWRLLGFASHQQQGHGDK